MVGCSLWHATVQRPLCRSRGWPTPMLRSRWWVTTAAVGGGSPDRARDPDRTFLGSNAWARNLQTPLRAFLHTESGSAGILLLATVAALAWSTSLPARTTRYGKPRCRSGSGTTASLDLREWVNSGLMTFFFFVVGLEARREFDMGELRERRRVALPVLAGSGA